MFGVVAAAVVLGGLVVFLKVRRAFPDGVRAGDFVKVGIPRTADRPLAMGTRMDIAAALKKRGDSPGDLRSLIDGTRDQELLDRYWAASDREQRQ